MPRDREGHWHEEQTRPRRPAPPSGSFIANLRKHPRFEIDDSGATLILKGFLSLIGLGRSRETRDLLNLSEGGALVVASEPLPRGKKVCIRFYVGMPTPAARAAYNDCVLPPHRRLPLSLLPFETPLPPERP